MRKATVLAALLVLGCATPDELRQSGRRDSVTVAGDPLTLARCLVIRLDESIPAWTHTVREGEGRVSVLTRREDWNGAITDLARSQAGTVATIAVSTGLLQGQSFLDTIRDEVERCGKRSA